VTIIAMLLVPCDECHKMTDFTDCAMVDGRRLCADCLGALWGETDAARGTSDEETDCYDS
jgi:hypothetical protein